MENKSLPGMEIETEQRHVNSIIEDICTIQRFKTRKLRIILRKKFPLLYSTQKERRMS